ncbi:FAD-binding oxidoreductase [Actinoallomurus sp. CA-142502]|uniref:FAD-binding oxidoreductase n=1 Tax=Actinoallomurus sp. CA-142502 TaxID=3239885 RepID=UPI003D92A897
MTTGLAGDLRDALPGVPVVDDPDALSAYARDQVPGLPAGKPAAAVFPAETAEVQEIMRIASRTGTPVVTQGAATGLAGAANAVDGCLILSTRRMDRILEIDAAEGIAVVQPGVVNARLREAAQRDGRFYPPDPGSFEACTIGGNVATGAGGMCCVKYGVTADYVRALEVVLADGSVLRTGRRTVKGVAGYDLVKLFTGSEGTLGVITEVTVALRAAPAPPRTVVAEFGSLAAAGAAISAVLAGGATPSLVEILDRTTLAAIESWQPLGIGSDVAALVLLQSDAADADAQTEAWSGVLEGTEATGVYKADDAAESELLMQARRLAYPALERLGGTLLDDVAVPRGALTTLIEGVERIAAAHGLTIGVFGHAGDGNLHPTIVYDRADPAGERRAFAAFDDIVSLALDLGGTVTGEHGVGLLKRSWLARELDPVALRVHASIKAALDPAGLLNPSKVFEATAG